MPSKLGDGYMYRPKQINDLQFNEDLINLNIPTFWEPRVLSNLVDYMMGDNSVLDIRSRQIDIHQIDTEKLKQKQDSTGF